MPQADKIRTSRGQSKHLFFNHLRQMELTQSRTGPHVRQDLSVAGDRRLIPTGLKRKGNQSTPGIKKSHRDDFRHSWIQVLVQCHQGLPAAPPVNSVSPALALFVGTTQGSTGGVWH